MIGEATRAQASRAGAGQAVVFDVPLLAESGTWRARVDRVRGRRLREATQVARVVQRSGWTADAVERTIAQQASRAQRRAIADAVDRQRGAVARAARAPRSTRCGPHGPPIRDRTVAFL